MCNSSRAIFHFWQPHPNIHEEGWVCELSRRGRKTTVLLTGALSEERRAQGVKESRYSGSTVIEIGLDQISSYCERNNSPFDVHILTGIREFRAHLHAYDCLRTSSARIFYLSESKDKRGLKGVLRLLRDKISERERKYRVDAVLAMGQLGVSWFKRIGYPETKIHEYCYCPLDPESPQVKLTGTCEPGQLIRFSYVGQLTRRKRVDLLLRAFDRLAQTRPVVRWHLDIVGTGPERNNLEEFTNRAGISNEVSFHGPLASDQVWSMLQSADSLILPSDWDGWGAVVNEALLRGKYSIASNQCGSSSVSHTPLGETFEAGDHNSLFRKVSEYIQLHSNSSFPVKSTRQSLATARIGQAAVTDYLLKIVEATFDDRPTSISPPWSATAKE